MGKEKYLGSKLNKCACQSFAELLKHCYRAIPPDIGASY